MQEAIGEWTLGLQIEHIDRDFNVEIRNDQYCCCDTNPDIVPCGDTLAGLSVEECKTVCAVYFVVHGTCSVTKFYKLTDDTCSPYPLSTVVFPISFGYSELSNQVSF